MNISMLSSVWRGGSTQAVLCSAKKLSDGSSIERRQSRIQAETRHAVGTVDRVRPAHIDVDVRVVLWWGHADALEFPHPDADFKNAAVVPELRMAAPGHRLSPL